MCYWAKLRQFEASVCVWLSAKKDFPHLYLSRQPRRALGVGELLLYHFNRSESRYLIWSDWLNILGSCRCPPCRRVVHEVWVSLNRFRFEQTNSQVENPIYRHAYRNRGDGGAKRKNETSGWEKWTFEHKINTQIVDEKIFFAFPIKMIFTKELECFHISIIHRFLFSVFRFVSLFWRHLNFRCRAAKLSVWWDFFSLNIVDWATLTHNSVEKEYFQREKLSYGDLFSSYLTQPTADGDENR